MTDKPVPSLTDRQLKTARVLHEIKLARILFWFVLALFAVAFIMLIVSVFFVKAAAWVQIGFFLFNGILGYAMKSLLANLFPKKGTEPEASGAHGGT